MVCAPSNSAADLLCARLAAELRCVVPRAEWEWYLAGELKC